MSDMALRLDHISRYFGKVKAVDDLRLEIPAGKFVTLLGPSGCGKSTTLSLIAGLDRLDDGRILLGDQDITDTPPNERRMAMVFQNYALYPHMTAYDNIAFGLKLQHRPKAEVDSRVKAVAANLDISHLLKRKPGQMSGGQQQRVALGRALVKEPVVFLLDEPFSNLDAGLRVADAHRGEAPPPQLGTTSVFVTHDQEEAMSLSDFIAVMRDGKIVQFGHDQGDLPQAARPVRGHVRRQAEDEPRRRRARPDGRPRRVRVAGSARRPGRAGGHRPARRHVRAGRPGRARRRRQGPRQRRRA